MFFAKPGEYSPCGLYSIGHFIIFIITCLFIYIVLKKTKHLNNDGVLKVIRFCTLGIWILEFIRIIFVLSYTDIRDVNAYVPLYYCSLLLYSSLMSSYGKWWLKKCGDVFLATGCMVGGIIFMITPTTSLPTYPLFHFISIHSFLFHGIMVYLGLLVNYTKYVKIKLSDIKYFASLVSIICLFAYIVNTKLDSNLMFISDSFVNSPIQFIYDFTGRYYTLFMCAVQATLPFYIVYGIRKVLKRRIDLLNKKVILEQ